MKKFLALMIVLVLALSLGLSMASCKKGGKTSDKPDDSTEISTTAEQSGTSEKQATKLDAPVVTISEEGLATWTAVGNAVRYQYKLGETEMQTAKTSLQLEDGQTIQVKAIGDGENYLDSDYSAAMTYTAPAPAIVTGIPAPAEGYYMTNADLIQDGETRYLLYTTNMTAGEDDNAFAVMTGELNDDEEWVYGEGKVVLSAGAEDAWDRYLLSASIVKGEFAMGGETYNWLLAYAATDLATGTAAQIGLAVSKTVDGEYTRVGAPVITYDKDAYGATMAGCYAPSAINYNKQSGIRIFYTYADKYGHFSFFWDADLSDLENVDGQGAMGVNDGDLHSGDAVLMFPNSDMAYDATEGLFVAVKDYSPSAATAPSFAERIELCWIDEDELYTTDPGYGWLSLGFWDTFDLELDLEYERAYSACIVSDAYGHMMYFNNSVEIVYNTCMTKATTENYMYTQILVSYLFALPMPE